MDKHFLFPPGHSDAGQSAGAASGQPWAHTPVLLALGVNPSAGAFPPFKGFSVETAREESRLWSLLYLQMHLEPDVSTGAQKPSFNSVVLRRSSLESENRGTWWWWWCCCWTDTGISEAHAEYPALIPLGSRARKEGMGA